MKMEMTMQYERGFKLVGVAYNNNNNNNNNTYWSWASPVSGAVEYKIGEWTMPLPGNGPLAVFNTMDDLLRFTSYDLRKCPRNSRAFEVGYIRSTECALWVGSEDIHSVIKTSLYYLPTGTVIASRVRLLREIQVGR